MQILKTYIPWAGASFLSESNAWSDPLSDISYWFITSWRNLENKITQLLSNFELKTKISQNWILHPDLPVLLTAISALKKYRSPMAMTWEHWCTSRFFRFCVRFRGISKCGRKFCQEKIISIICHLYRWKEENKTIKSIHIIVPWFEIFYKLEKGKVRSFYPRHDAFFAPCRVMTRVFLWGDIIFRTLRFFGLFCRRKNIKCK